MKIKVDTWTVLDEDDCRVGEVSTTDLHEEGKVLRFFPDEYTAFTAEQLQRIVGEMRGIKYDEDD